ncbi:MAG: UDP-N-acetylglucosamine 2-epimerase (non-hydrolyzing) [Tissierellia bacterium]|nr:UDP-N-acetylglucosamine 2-epimerase (non-hydrolyzing) [Tissierellia bacterium]
MKVLTVFGTRPEAIKMAPIVKELEKNSNIESRVCVTGQHREILDQVLEVFDIKPDFDLDIFKPGQSLSQITTKALLGMEKVIEEFRPDLLLIQGDTTTVFTGALAAFYHKIPVGHVEAGLRSENIYSPYPEEANRKLTSVITSLHFAPTEIAKENLLQEGYNPADIYVTGNTVIDALKYTVKDKYIFDKSPLDSIQYNNKVILLTSHRRENWGEPMERIFSAMKKIVEMRPEVELIFPVHPNPKVRTVADKYLKGMDRVHLIEPLSYEPFCNLMAKSHIVVTDSGGVQEEAPTLGKPVLVVREETERPEGIEAGTAKLLGTDEAVIIEEVLRLLDDENSYKSMANAVNPYGDGYASKRIVEIICNRFL